MKKSFLSLCAALLVGASAFGQGSTDYGTGIRMNLSEDKSKYIRLITWNQIWFRSTEQNPGTTVGGKAVERTTDIGARRLRFLAMAQVSKRYMVVAHWGINNQTFINGGGSGTTGNGGYGNGKKPQIFFHDAYNEYKVIFPTKENKNTSLDLGGGLMYMLGISRMSNASTLNFMAVDSPIFTWPTVDMSDQFARQFGFYAKGKFNKFEYRLMAAKPFYTSAVPTNVTVAGKQTAVDNNADGKWSKMGYFEYQFGDSESNALPFKVGTYLGTKKVFNIGAGFYHAPAGTKSSLNGTVSSHPITLTAVDVFVDRPVGKKEKGAAVTAYAGYFNYNFGPNYLRNVGIMNEGAADAAYSGSHKVMSGPGNAQPLIGTGSNFYTQVGYLMPKGSDKPKMRVQPFTAFTYKNLDAIKTANNGKAIGLTNFDFGVNWLLDGHHAKITTQYSLRPNVETSTMKQVHMGEFITQLQIYL